ncbi:MAG: hypothetical protein RLZZ584_2485 [Pseudomonadota bacterium]
MTDAVELFRAAVRDALGAAPDVIRPGVFERFGVEGKRGDYSAWCKLFDDGRAGIYGDFRSGASLVWINHTGPAPTAAQRAAIRAEFARAQALRKAVQAEGWERAAESNHWLWGQCWPIDAKGLQQPAALYLRRRLALPDAHPLELSDSLRCHRRLRYWSRGPGRYEFPALVAKLTQADGRMVALHRTWLTKTGEKAQVDGPVRKLTQVSGETAGACIRLANWRPMTTGSHAHLVGIAEGIETALSAMLGSGIPTHAAYCAGNLAAWQWPPEARRVAIFADNDSAGQDAAERLAHRVRAAGLVAHVLTPSQPGQDWCDVWAARPADTAPHALVHELNRSQA